MAAFLTPRRRIPIYRLTYIAAFFTFISLTYHHLYHSQTAHLISSPRKDASNSTLGVRQPSFSPLSPKEPIDQPLNILYPLIAYTTIVPKNPRPFRRTFLADPRSPRRRRIHRHHAHNTTSTTANRRTINSLRETRLKRCPSPPRPRRDPQLALLPRHNKTHYLPRLGNRADSRRRRRLGRTDQVLYSSSFRCSKRIHRHERRG